MATSAKLPQAAFFLEVIERERGWGAKSDGYLAFMSESTANEYIKKQYASRSATGPVPDYYVNYEKVGWNPVSAGVAKKLAQSAGTDRNFLCFDRLKDATK